MESTSQALPPYLKDANSGLRVYSGRFRDIPRRRRWRILPAVVQLVIKRSDMDDVLLGIVPPGGKQQLRWGPVQVEGNLP